MPRGDGTGPGGDGQKTGQGLGKGRGQGRGSGTGTGGFCVCSKCGEKVSHQMGTPCFESKCPKCGSAMIRETIGSQQ